MAIFSPADARRAVEHGFDDAVGFLADLVRVRSLLGAEEPAQQLVEERLRDLGFAVESVVPDPERLAERPDSGIPLMSYEGRRSLVGTIGEGGGRSLVLNGHVDVVSAEPIDRWTKEPFGAEVAGGRMYGRGSCDMKGGVAAMLLGVEAALAAGPLPGRLVYQSVIEEECGGNGALAAVLAGPPADAALIAEPTNGGMDLVAVGVIWARITLGGRLPPRLECRPRLEPDRGRLPRHPGAPRARGGAQRGSRARGRGARAAVPPERGRAARGRLAIDDSGTLDPRRAPRLSDPHGAGGGAGAARQGGARRRPRRPGGVPRLSRAWLLLRPGEPVRPAARRLP